MARKEHTHKNKHKSHKKHKRVHHKNDSDGDDIERDEEEIEQFDEVDEFQENDDGDNASEDDNDEQNKEINKKYDNLAEKTRDRLKKKIVEWLDSDDKIKEMNMKVKKYKEAKKVYEENIMTMITKLGLEENKIDVLDRNNEFRSRVYRHKSVTKGAIKEDIIKNALMEALRSEKRVDELIKKIDSKRPINERYYLKRTKGNGGNDQ